MKSTKLSDHPTISSTVEIALGELLSVYNEQLEEGTLRSNPAQESARLKQNIARLKTIIKKRNVSKSGLFLCK